MKDLIILLIVNTIASEAFYIIFMKFDPLFTFKNKFAFANFKD